MTADGYIFTALIINNKRGKEGSGGGNKKGYKEMNARNGQKNILRISLSEKHLRMRHRWKNETDF